MAETLDDFDKMTDGLGAEATRICKECGFDSVHIVATFICSDESTTAISAGHGNWHARMDSMRNVLIRDEENTRIFARRREENR